MDVVEYTPPGGESLEAVETRAVEFFCDLCRYEVHMGTNACACILCIHC